MTDIAPERRLFIVDVEASGPSPHSGKMTEFGVVDLVSRDWFHGRLHTFEPHPEVPARPVVTGKAPGVRVGSQGDTPMPAMMWNTDYRQGPGSQFVYRALADWLEHRAGDARITFVSDNPGYDFMWMAYGFDSHDLVNPFGHTARRIGDLAAGLEGHWLATSRWKRRRKTVHDHNPVNDALGNAEALYDLLLTHNQIKASA